ncbi:whiD domain protein [Mycobacterium tuberculosis variant bovis]|nr:whiD domain protein [Mycobacterium tuberculosis variant bovis]
MGSARLDHGAAPTHFLGALFALRSGTATLAVGMEEHR